MSGKDIAYKHGIWRMPMADVQIFDKNKIILASIERLKADIENHDGFDKNAQKMVNDLLYHYCWKLADNESN